jgi:hypothetical protein
MPAAIIVGALGASGATAAIGASIGAAITGSAVSAVTATMIGSAAVGATMTAVQGGDASDVLKSAVLGGITAGVGATVSSEVAGSLVDAGVDSAASAVIGKAAAGATNAAIRGGDIESGFISGGLGGLTSEIAQEISDSDFDEWSRQQAENEYDRSIAPTEQDVLAAYPDLEMNFPLSTPTDATGPGYYDEITGEFIPDNLGGLQAPLTNDSGTGGLNIDVPSMEGKNPQPTEFKSPTAPEPEVYDPALSKNQIKQGLDLGISMVRANNQDTPGLNQPMPLTLGMQESSGLDAIPWLSSKHEMLVNKPLDLQKNADPYQAMVNQPINTSNYTNNLDPSLASVLSERGYGNLEVNSNPISVLGYSTGGSTETDLDKALNPKFAEDKSPDVLTTSAVRQRQPLHKKLIQMQENISHLGNMGGMAKGGLPKKYQDAAPDGHNPEFVTGLTGFYACGRGTGQSDCIPAMLHDGDYVMDAEAVSALGDGSSKAGKEVLEKFHKQVPHNAASGGKVVPAKIADGEYVFPAGFVTALGGGDNKRGAEILDGLREKLRNHKRSAPTSKIPPKAKSPLDYLKMAKG